jgi:peroxiredoxin family protein
MVKTLLICKDGTFNSYLSSLVIAMNTKKNGGDVAIVFMQGGLAALLNKGFRFSPELEVYSKDIKENATMMGVPSDPFKLIEEAKSMGVPLYACQAWMKLLGGKPPKFDIPKVLEKLELSDLVVEIEKAEKVVSI